MQMLTSLAADLSVEPRSFLTLLHREAWIGGLDVFPGLLAEVDQHAAAVRDAIGPGAGHLHEGDLAAYARGVAAATSAWDWAQTPAEAREWVRLRLASVCCLALDYGHLELSPAVL